jgi:SanA protein
MVIGLVLLAVAGAALMWIAYRALDGYAAPFIASDPAKLPAVDVALVLGAAPIGPEGGPNVYLKHRLDAAAALWKAGKIKYVIASGNREGTYDEPTPMREGLIARGVPASAIYRDFEGARTLDSVGRAKSIYGQTRLIIVSQRFHAARAIYLARKSGIEAWALEAPDVERAFRLWTELRPYPSALIAYGDVLLGTPPRGGPKVAIGVDPPN